MSSNESVSPQALIQQITQATDRLSDQEATQRYQHILSQLPPEQAAELNALALSQIGHNERRGLAGQFRQAHHNPSTPFDGYTFDDDDEAASPLGLGRMSARAQQQDPALLGGLLGGNSPLGGQIGKAALAALAAILMRRMLSGQQAGGQMGGGQMGGDMIGSILGGLLGGGQGGQAGYGQGGDMIGSILGGLLGGGGQQQMPGGFGGQQQMPGGLGGQQRMPGGLGGQQQMPGGLDLGSILGGLLGSGSMARQAPQGGGLGDLLGSILGGSTGDSSRSHRR